MSGLAEEIGKQFEEQQALIRELVVTLEQIAEATYDDRPASRFQLIDWARCALAKAKAAGYEP